MKTTKLGSQGANFFAYAQMKNCEIVQLGDIQKPLGLSAQQERKLLQRLANNGFILRLKRGVYLVPERLPAGGGWQPNEYYLIAKYMELFNSNYFIGGHVVMHHHGFTSQIPQVYTVYNDKISSNKQIGGLRVNFIKIPEKCIKGTINSKLPYRNTMVKIASVARTLMDAVQDWARYGTLPEAYLWIKDNIDNSELIDELIKLTARYANKTTIRRIGYVLEKLNVNPTRLRALTKRLGSLTKRIKLDPMGPKTRVVDKKWGVIINVK